MSNISSTPFSFYSPQLDGLRFVAAILVFIHHAPPLPILSRIRDEGWIGVDLFLSISAFLLTRLLMLEFQRTGKLQIKNFFIRRALRIWPLYFFFATFVCVFGIIRRGQDAITTFGWWLSHLTFTNNIMTALKGYSPVPYSAHLWTISLEEQAYLIMPFLLLAFLLSGSRRTHLLFFALSSLVILLGARLGFYLNDTPHPFVWVLPLRADAFIIGAVAAIVTEDMQIKHPVTCMTLGVLLMCSVVFFPNPGEHSLFQVFGYLIVACGCALVVVSSQGYVFQKSALASRPMRYLGKISYGFYVYHIICISLAIRLLDFFGLAHAAWQFLVAIFLTMAISSSSYFLLEKPFLQLKARFTTILSRPI